MRSFITIRRKNGYCEYIIAKEQHEDESYHLHVYIKTAKKMDIKIANLLGLSYKPKTITNRLVFGFSNDNNRDNIIQPQNFHGNYQSGRNPQAVIKYCKKEGDFITSI